MVRRDGPEGTTFRGRGVVGGVVQRRSPVSIGVGVPVRDGSCCDGMPPRVKGEENGRCWTCSRAASTMIACHKYTHATTATIATQNIGGRGSTSMAVCTTRARKRSAAAANIGEPPSCMTREVLTRTGSTNAGTMMQTSTKNVFHSTLSTPWKASQIKRNGLSVHVLLRNSLPLSAVVRGPLM